MFIASLDCFDSPSCCHSFIFHRFLLGGLNLFSCSKTMLPLLLFVFLLNFAQFSIAADCAGCKAYKCMDDEVAHCGSAGYLIGYGERNCEHFTSTEIYEQFDAIGRQFVNCTGACLLGAMREYISAHKSAGIDCAALQTAGFQSHPRCYLDCGFCRMCKTNKWALLHGYDLRDFLSAQAIRQVWAVLEKCGILGCLLNR